MITNRHIVLTAILGIVVLSHPVGADCLEVRLQPAQAVFTSAIEVKLWLTLVNAGSGCVPLFVDPGFSVSPSPVRPLSEVTLFVFDHQGKRVVPRSKVEADPTTMRPHEIILLGCGRSYGIEVVLVQIPWSYDLSPGRYTARTRVVVPVASFLKKRDAVAARLESLWENINIGSFIRDAEGESADVRFTVSGNTK